MFFYVTWIGCGIAGFGDKEIAPLFAEAIESSNQSAAMMSLSRPLKSITRLGLGE